MSQKPRSLGQRIRIACIDRGLSLKQLSVLAHVSYTHLSNLINDKNKPRIDTLERLETALDKPLRDRSGAEDDIP